MVHLRLLVAGWCCLFGLSSLGFFGFVEVSSAFLCRLFLGVAAWFAAAVAAAYLRLWFRLCFGWLALGGVWFVSPPPFGFGVVVVSAALFWAVVALLWSSAGAVYCSPALTRSLLGGGSLTKSHTHWLRAALFGGGMHLDVLFATQLVGILSRLRSRRGLTWSTRSGSPAHALDVWLLSRGWTWTDDWQ